MGGLLLKKRAVRDVRIFSIAILSLLVGFPLQAMSQDNNFSVRVISKDTRQPLESTIEVYKEGNWIALGVTSNGRLTKRNVCADFGMLRASPIDKAYRRSTPVHCLRAIEIALSRVGSSQLAVTDLKGCVPLAYMRKTPDRIGEQVLSWNANFYSMELAEEKVQVAQPIWIRTKGYTVIRAEPYKDGDALFAVIGGTELIPTKRTVDDWWEVSDTSGSRTGWIQESMFDLAPDKFGLPDPCRIPNPGQFAPLPK